MKLDEINQNLDKENKTQERYFKIDYDIFFNENLSTTAKFLFPVIELLDNDEIGCFASNEYLGAFLGYSPRNISKAVAELKSEGFIDTLVFDGKMRIMRVLDNTNRKEKINKTIKDQKQRIQNYLDKNDTIKLAKEHRAKWNATMEQVSDLP